MRMMKYLNGIRSDHDDLVQACLGEEVSVNGQEPDGCWFQFLPDAVSGILKNATKITVRLLKLDVKFGCYPKIGKTKPIRWMLS